VTTINHKINYEKALNHINSLISQKEIPYGAFLKGSNCARFVTDTIIVASTKKKVSRRLKTSNLFTPSPIGNIIKGNTTDEIFEVYQQEISPYQNRSVLKEYKECFLQTYDNLPNLIGTEKPDLQAFNLKNGTWLGGIGSGAWFNISKQISENTFEIERYTAKGLLDFKGTFETTSSYFTLDQKYTFLHPTNCNEAFVKQGKQTFTFLNTNYL
jgi:hypothetical protein